MGESGDTTSTGGGIYQGVGKFLQVGGAGDYIIWVADVVPFGVNYEEDIGDTHRVPATDHGEESEAIMVCDMGDARGGKRMRGSGKLFS